MNTKRFRAFALVAMFALLTMPSMLRAQSDCYDTAAGGCGSWVVEPGPWSIVYNGCIFSFDSVSFRMCGGNVEINYNGLTETDEWSGACEFFKDSSLMQLADLVILDGISEGLIPVPVGITWDPGPCTNPPTGQTQVQFITTSCYIWQVCTYNTLPGPPVSCDPPENPPGPPPGNQVQVWTWHDCGTACCERDYNVCVDPTSGFLIDRLIDQHIINPPGCSKNADGTWTSRACNNGCSD